MKKILFLLVFLYSSQLFGQQEFAIKEQKAKDSLKSMLRSELQISNSKADSLMNIINVSIAQMKAVVQNRTLSKDARLSELRRYAAERDAKIGSLLSPEQVQQLIMVMSRNKTKIRNVPQTSNGAQRGH